MYGMTIDLFDTAKIGLNIKSNKNFIKLVGLSGFLDFKSKYERMDLM